MSVPTQEGIPERLLQDPVGPETIWETGSLGSPVLALRGGFPDVLRSMADAYAERFRKSWRDIESGIAVFMAPSRVHERATELAGDLVAAICAAQRLAVVKLRATTLIAEGGGGEPDESFYFGEKAERYLSLERELGVSGADGAFDPLPADLAVEVEHTHYDSAKRDIYRRAGVLELWEFATAPAGGEAAIVDLQAPDGPRPVVGSTLVPGVHADGLDGALRVLREIGGLVEFSFAAARGAPVVERLLAAARAAAFEQSESSETPGR